MPHSLQTSLLPAPLLLKQHFLPVSGGKRKIEGQQDFHFGHALVSIISGPFMTIRLEKF